MTNFISYDMIIIDINNTYATFCKFQVCYIVKVVSQKNIKVELI